MFQWFFANVYKVKHKCDPENINILQKEQYASFYYLCYGHVQKL